MALFMVEIKAKMVLFMACPTETSPATSITEKAKQVGYLCIMAVPYHGVVYNKTV